MGFNLKVPPGFRFDPTDGEMLDYLQWRLNDLNANRLAFIPNIRMQDHDPSELPWLGAVTGKDGIMYFFAVWDKKYLKGKRLDRQVKKGSMKGRWKEVSGFEPIRSSDGDKEIGTKKNFVFKVGDSLIEWHMEEYRLCTEEPSQVSICRVSKKCSQARGTTKIDAKVDNRPGEQRHFDHVTEVANCPKSLQETHSYDLHISHSAAETYNSNGEEEAQPYWCNVCYSWYPHDETLHRSLRNLCNRLHDQDQNLLFWLNSILEGFECECPLPNVGDLGPQANNSKGKKKAGQSCISDTGNGPERETFDMDSGREINKGQKDGGPPSWCNLCWGLHAPKESGYSCCDNLLTTSPPLNVDNPDTGNYQSANDVTEMENCFLSPDHSYPICSNAAEEYVDNLDTRNDQSANDNVLLDMPNWVLSLDDIDLNRSNPAEEYVPNPDTGNGQSADDTVLYMNDVTEMVYNLDTRNGQSANDTILLDMPNRTLDDIGLNWPNPAEEYVHNPDTRNGQSADDTVPMDMDDAIKTGNCVLSPEDSLKDYLHKIEGLLLSPEQFGEKTHFKSCYKFG